MARVRKISRHPSASRPNYFLVDACFLAEKHLPINTASAGQPQQNLRESKRWWEEIDRQLDAQRARVYIPDVFIAEAFKVLAKKYYQEDSYTDRGQYDRVRRRLSEDLRTPGEVLKRKERHIRFHDLPTSRDVIIAVDRFYELFMRHKKNVSVPDLLLVASAKYLMDFHDAQRDQIHMVTMDTALWSGTKKISELPNAYNPWEPADHFDRVFR